VRSQLLARKHKTVTDETSKEEQIEHLRLATWAMTFGLPAVKRGLENTRSDFCSHSLEFNGQTRCSWCEPFLVALENFPGEEFNPDEF
jgi:hypothetical protein